MEKKEDGIKRRVIGIIINVFNCLPSLYWWVGILLSSGSSVGVSILLFYNPLFWVLFGVSLAIVAFAIIVIFVGRKEEKKREKKVQLTGCEIIRDDSIDKPKITMTQRFANMNEDTHLKLSKVNVVMKANGIKLVKFFCNSPNLTSEFGDEIKASENGVFTPLNLDCWIKCETENIRLVPEFREKVIEITVSGEIEFVVTLTKTRVVKKIEGRESITFKAKRERIVS